MNEFSAYTRGSLPCNAFANQGIALANHSDLICLCDVRMSQVDHQSPWIALRTVALANQLEKLHILYQGRKIILCRAKFQRCNGDLHTSQVLIRISFFWESTTVCSSKET